jgi:hypothetical protein
MLKKIRKCYRKASTNTKNFISSASEFIIFLSFILIILILLAVASITITYIRSSLSLQSVPLFYNISNFIFKLSLGKALNELTNNQQQYFLLIFINVFVFFTSLFFAVTPIFSYLKKKNDFKKTKSIRCEIIHTPGIDDLQIMGKYYKGADLITVFSGDFDWIGKNPDIYKEFVTLANKGDLCLVSNKEEEIVKEVLKDEIYSSLKGCFIFNKESDIKCSYVKRSNNEYFLYKQEYYVDGKEQQYVHILRTTDESRYLLSVLNMLIRNIVASK